MTHKKRSGSRSSSPEKSPRISRRNNNRFRRSASPSSPNSRRASLSCGYDQYSKSLLEVPISTDYGDASSDDLSSEWDSDVPEPVPPTRSKVRFSKKFLFLLLDFVYNISDTYCTSRTNFISVYKLY